MSFKSSLNQGEIGEALFYMAHEGTLRKESGRKSDFTHIETGKTIELKTDYWEMSKTPNFFFERYSDKEMKSPGGPWQAREHGSDVFAYFYVKNLTFFTFDTRELVGRLEELIPNIEPTDVRNKSWTTLGYRVPRKDIMDIAVEWKMSVSLEDPKDD